MDVASDCQTVVQGAGFFLSPQRRILSFPTVTTKILWAAVAAELRVDTRIFKGQSACQTWL